MAHDRTLIQIRERGYLDVLDLAMVVVRHRPLTLGAAALLGIAPWAGLNAWLLADVDVPPVVLLLLLAVEAPWATAPLTVVLGGLMFGRRPTVGRVLRGLLRGLFPMVVYQGVLRLALLSTLFFLPLIPTKFAFLNEVILLEGGRWWRAGRRSADLCRDRGGELFGQWLAQFAFGALFVACFFMATGTLGQTLISEPTWDWPEWADVYDGRMQVATWLAIAFFAVARFFSYIDQRIRLEGWAVELRLRMVASALEDSGRWAESR